MGRIVGEWTGGRAEGRRFRGLGSRPAALLLAVAGWASADDDGPDLLPPSNVPQARRPAPVLARPAASPGGRAVLAVPGLGVPTSRPLVSTPSTVEVAPEEPLADGLPLDAPIEMRGKPVASRPGRSGALESPPRGDRLLPDEAEFGPLPSTRRTPSSPRPEDDPAPPRPAPARRSRFFGLIPGPAVGTVPPAPRSVAAGRAVSEGSGEEPSPDASLKRRIERQAREAVGDRARSIDVRLVGKGAAIQARGVKFFQKRAVRKSLESLPALSGLRSTIEVAD